MKPKKRLTPKVSFDTAVAALMATGMAGLVVATRDDEPPQEQSEHAATQTPGDAPGLGATPFADPVLPPPPAHEPGQHDVFSRPETEDLLIAELLPPVEAAPPIGWVRPIEPPQSVAVDGTQNLPPTPAIIQAEETPPPPLQEDENNEENEMSDEEEVGPAMAMTGGQDSAPMQSPENDQPNLGAPVSAQGMAEQDWLANIGNPGVPQSQAGDIGILFLPLAETESEKLTDIVFGDPVLDAHPVTMIGHELFEIRNGNELWVIGGHDLSNGYGHNQVYLQFFSAADPSLYASAVVYIQDDHNVDNILNPDDGQDENEIDGNEFDMIGGEQVYDPNGPDIDEQAANMNPNPFAAEPEPFEPEFEYHTGPDII